MKEILAMKKILLPKSFVMLGNLILFFQSSFHLFLVILSKSYKLFSWTKADKAA